MTDQVTSTATIIIEDAPVGYQVRIVPDLWDGHFDLWCESRLAARSYARGLTMERCWRVEDHTAEPILVEQLNAAQWHAVHPNGRCCVGVGNYAHVLASALFASTLRGCGVVSVDLDGTRLVLAHEEDVDHG